MPSPPTGRRSKAPPRWGGAPSGNPDLFSRASPPRSYRPPPLGGKHPTPPAAPPPDRERPPAPTGRAIIARGGSPWPSAATWPIAFRPNGAALESAAPLGRGAFWNPVPISRGFRPWLLSPAPLGRKARDLAGRAQR